MTNPFLRAALIAASLLLFNKAKTQVSTSFGPEVGFSVAAMYASEDDIEAGVHGHVGGTAHIQFGKFLALRPSVLLRYGSFQDDVDSDYKATITRLFVPVPVLYSHVFANNNKIFVGAGPSFNINLAGKVKGPNEDVTIKFGNSESDDIKRAEIGLHVKGGFQFGNGASLSLFFNQGFSNLNPNSAETKVRSVDLLGFSFGWMFGGRSSD